MASARIPHQLWLTQAAHDNVRRYHTTNSDTEKLFEPNTRVIRFLNLVFTGPYIYEKQYSYTMSHMNRLSLTQHSA